MSPGNKNQNYLTTKHKFNSESIAKFNLAPTNTSVSLHAAVLVFFLREENASTIRKDDKATLVRGN